MLRRWRWILHTAEAIEEYLHSLQVKTSSIEFVLPVDGIVARVISDSTELLTKVQSRFTKKAVLDVGEKHSLQLIYLTHAAKTPQKCINTADGMLYFKRSRTDVAFDPLSRILLIHGPNDSGYVKSLLFGMLSHQQVEKERYGLHAGVIASHPNGVAYVGSHGTGKTTHALLALLSRQRRRIVTDDWALFYTREKGYFPFAEGVERCLFVDEAMIYEIKKALPKTAHNRDLISNLQNVNRKAVYMDSRSTVLLKSIFGEHKISKNTAIGTIFCLTPHPMDHVRRVPRSTFVRHMMTTSYHIPFHTPASQTELQRAVSIRGDRSIQRGAEYALGILEREYKFWEGIYKKCDIRAIGTRGNSVKHVHSKMEQYLESP